MEIRKRERRFTVAPVLRSQNREPCGMVGYREHLTIALGPVLRREDPANSLIVGRYCQIFIHHASLLISTLRGLPGGR